MKDLKGKIAVVTGASRDVGKGVALGLAAHGATVYVTGRTEDDEGLSDFLMRTTIHNTVEEIQKSGGEAVAHRCDFSIDEDIEVLFDRVQMNKTDIDIISKVNAEVRGLYNFYQIAENVSTLDKFSFIMEYSMYKTFAAKYKSSVSKIISRYSRDGVFGVDYQTKAGAKRCEFYNGGFKRSGKTELIQFEILPQYRKYDKPNSLAARIRAGVCEYCGQQTDDVRMHHVRKLADLTSNTAWEQIMLAKRRKSLALCPICHRKIHDGLL